MAGILAKHSRRDCIGRDTRTELGEGGELQRLPAAVVGPGGRRRREARHPQPWARAAFHANHGAAAHGNFNTTERLGSRRRNQKGAATAPHPSAGGLHSAGLPDGPAPCCGQVPRVLGAPPRSQCPSARPSPPSPFLPPYTSPPADLNQSLTGSHTGATTDCTQTRPSCLSGGATCQVHDTSTSPGRASTEGVSRPELNGAQTPLESVGDGPLFKIICSSAGSKLWTTF